VVGYIEAPVCQLPLVSSFELAIKSLSWGTIGKTWEQEHLYFYNFWLSAGYF